MGCSLSGSDTCRPSDSNHDAPHLYCRPGSAAHAGYSTFVQFSGNLPEGCGAVSTLKLRLATVISLTRLCNYPVHLHRGPCPAAGRRDASGIQLLGNLAKRACSTSANVIDHWAKVFITLFSPFYSRGNAGAVSFDRDSLHALRINDAATAFIEAIQIRRSLAKANPQAHLPYLATTLNNLGNLCLDAGRLKEAEDAYSESLSIRRNLARANAEGYLPGVAQTLSNLGILYKAEGQDQEAVAFCAEALAIYKQLANDNPDKFGDALSQVCVP